VADETQANKLINNIENNQQNTGKASNTMTETPLFDFLLKKEFNQKKINTPQKNLEKTNFTH
jgi:hypothetical protein